jgi:hypothetical protein
MRVAKLTTLLIALAAFGASFGASFASAVVLEGFDVTYQEPTVAPNTSFPSSTEITQAGSHADVITNIRFDQVDPDNPKDIVTDLPAGFYGSPLALPFCSAAALEANEGYCNPEAQVGVYYLDFSLAGDQSYFWELPIYNMKSSTEQTAVFEANVLGVLVKLIVSVRTDGDYGLRVTAPNLNSALQVRSAFIEFWGVPASPEHDQKRCKFFFDCGYPSTVPVRPLLSMPTRCEPIVAEVQARSWQKSDIWVAETDTYGPLTGCDAFDFSPTLKARPTTTATDAPSGLDVDLFIPQSEDPEGLATAELRDAEISFPEDFVLNPAGANGLEACTPEQIGMIGPPGQGGATKFEKPKPDCPDASRVGTVQIDTPLLADPMLGSVYIATPYDNPYESLFAIYVTFRGPGLDIKVPAEMRADPTTGRLTTVFRDSPQLPFSNFKFNLFGGAFAPFRTPPTCGTYATNSILTPWSAPASGPPATPNDVYAISQVNGGKGDCPTTKTALPNTPAFEGGSLAALAGQYKPFVVNLRRSDGTQEFSTITVKPPPGLVAKLAGTSSCSDGALAASAGKSGRQELASPSCPAGSEVGNFHAAAGAGPAPYNVPGKVYLAGPYKGAPLSLALISPAVAGPFDLGNVVTRVAVFLDPTTAEITAQADPIPDTLKGVPLDVRSVSIRLDKPDFALNPSSCDPTAVTGSVLSLEGSTALLNSRFQLAECGRLKLKPKISLKLRGGSKRRQNPALTVTLRPRPGDANLSGVTIALPRSEFLAQEHIDTICTRVQFNADNCPAGSIYGEATVQTPILDEPLTGHVYLRASDNQLPDLVLDLRGPPSRPIRIVAGGKTDSIKGGIRNTFSFVPDVPFTKLTVKLAGGKKSLLENSRNLCKKTFRADVSYRGHNGLKFSARPPLKAPCKAGKKGKRAGKKRGAGR